MTTATNIRSANAVSQRLRARGINVGYKHTDFGYVDRYGTKITEPGVQVTRNKPHRYSGYEDYGYVAVFIITPDDRPNPEYNARVHAALTDAGLPFEASRAGDVIKVLDDDDPVVLAAADRQPEPEPEAVRVLREHLASLPGGHHERPGLHRAIEILLNEQR